VLGRRPPPELDEYLRLYAAGRYFDAHEALEQAWRRSPIARMEFLQGLIQWSVAFEHHRRGNAHGARVLLERAWRRLRDAPPGYMGLDLEPLRAARPALAAAFAAWEAGGPRPAAPAPPIGWVDGRPPRPPEPAAATPAGLALGAARAETGRRLAAGGERLDLESDALAAAIEADPAAHEPLERAARERLAYDLPERRPSEGPAADRRARLAEARAAIDALVLAGELVPDGPGRVRLPGFGPSTLRALALLRAGASGPEGRWAAAVAAEPAGDLGPAAPPPLAGLRLDRALVEAARRLHAAEALRQDLRNASLTAAERIARALDAGERAGAEALMAEAAQLERALARIDDEIAAAWESGLEAAPAG
jgi:DUF309 family protein family protein